VKQYSKFDRTRDMKALYLVSLLVFLKLRFRKASMLFAFWLFCQCVVSIQGLIVSPHLGILMFARVISFRI
jgi:ethanolamine transporter EutH